MVKLWTLLLSFLGLALKRSAEKKSHQKIIVLFHSLPSFFSVAAGLQKGCRTGL